MSQHTLKLPIDGSFEVDSNGALVLKCVNEKYTCIYPASGLVMDMQEFTISAFAQVENGMFEFLKYSNEK